MGKKKTAGQIHTEILEKAASQPVTHTVQDQSTAMLADFNDLLIQIVEKEKANTPNTDFYIQYRLRQDPLLPTIFHKLFKTHLSCPKPDFDQAMFYYKANEDKVVHLWTIPDPQACVYFLQNPDHWETEDERRAVEFIFAFKAGTLDELQKKLNKPRKIIVPQA